MICQHLIILYLLSPYKLFAHSSPGISYIEINPLSALDIDFQSRFIPAFPQAKVPLSFSVLFIFVA